MRRVGHLLDQIRLNGESKELRDEIVDLGTRYGIVTPYTSYLVLETQERRRLLESGTIGGIAAGPRSRAAQESRDKDVKSAVSATAPPPPPATEADAARLSGQMDGLAQLSVAARGSSSAAGSDAVTFSKNNNELREAENLSTKPSLPDLIRQVAGKTFYQRDGVWTDSEFKADAKLPVVKLKFASDEYFDLIGKEPKLAECFALGPRVVVVWNGKVYQVEE
jgi:Ca-activated chloride channel family protein